MVIDYGGSVLSGDTVQAVRRHDKARTCAVRAYQRVTARLWRVLGYY